jgi:hypothetical protein
MFSKTRNQTEMIKILFIDPLDDTVKYGSHNIRETTENINTTKCSFHTVFLIIADVFNILTLIILSVYIFNDSFISVIFKKVNFINSSQNEGLSPSGITLSFYGFDSTSWHSFFWLFYSFHNLLGLQTFSAWASLKRLN